MLRVASLLCPLLALVGCREPSPDTTPPVEPVEPVEPASSAMPLGPGVLEISVSTCAISPDARVWCRGSEQTDEDPGWLPGASAVDRLWLADDTVCVGTKVGVRCMHAEDSDQPLPSNAEGWLATPAGTDVIDVAWDDGSQCLVDARGQPWCRWLSWEEDAPIPPLERYPIAGVRDVEIADEIGCMRLADQSVHCFFGAGILMISELEDPALAATVSDWCAARPDAPTCDQPIGGRSDWPAPIRVLDAGRDIAVGSNYACVIDDRGAVGCLTLMEYPGEPMIGDSHDFAQIPGLPPMVEIDGSDEHVCGRSEADEVWCWGSNEYGQLGDGTTTSHANSHPVKAGQWPGLRQISVGFGKSCAVTNETLECWGWISEQERLDPPTEIPGIRASALASREYTTCAREGRTWKCWGAETGGLAGATGAAQIVEVDRFADKPAPECEIDDKRRMTCFDDEGELTWDIPDVIDALPGYSNTCVLLDRKVACLSAALPSLGQTEFEVPASTAMSGLDWHGCVLDTGGKPHCWAGRDHVVQAIALPTKLVSVVASTVGDCGLDTGGKVHCWGGEDPATTPFTLELANIVELVGALEQICARDRDGVVRCWGDRITVDETVDPRTPVTIAVPAATQLVAGFDHVCSLAADGRVSCWGGEIESQRARVSADFSLRPQPVDFFGP